MSKIKVVSPLRLQTYRDERNNTQTFQWVIGEYESSQLAKWKSVVNGAKSMVQEVHEVDIVAEMYFSVSKNTSEGGAVLKVCQVPTLTLGGECHYGGDTEWFTITEDMWGTNSLQVLLNGVRQKKGEDVFFSGLDDPDEEGNRATFLTFRKRLQKGDLIVIDHYRGV